MKITIGNRRKGDKGEYVGRPSPLGNPFPLGPRSREKTIAQYRGWLEEKIRQRDPVVCGELDRLHRLARAGEICLTCWCHPLSCHAEVIRQTLLDWKGGGAI